MVRLRHTDHALSINGAVPEIVMLNAHDGTSSMRLLSGLFRLVCSNGLVVQSHALVEEVRIRHTHKALEEALTAARTVMAASIEAAHRRAARHARASVVAATRGHRREGQGAAGGARRRARP